MLCSQTFDDKTGDTPWSDITDQLELARDNQAVTFLHAHDPGRTVSMDRIAAVLDRVDALGLDYVTFPELVPGPPRAAVAIAFDDTFITKWYGLRDLFAAHHARVTFFITRLYARSDDELAQLAELAADGHAVEAHSVEHLDAQDYVCDHGVDAYMSNEAVPSITGLRDLGYEVTSYAYPFGNNAPDLDDAVLRHVHRVRVSPGSCPY